MPANKRRRRWKLEMGKRKENPLATINIGMPHSKKRRIEHFFQKNEIKLGCDNNVHLSPSQTNCDYREGRQYKPENVIAATGHQKRENPGTSKINNIRDMFQKLSEKENQKKEENEERNLSEKKNSVDFAIASEVTSSTNNDKISEFQNNLNYFKNKEIKNFSSKGSARKKNGVKNKITSKMKITNFFAKAQTGECKYTRGSSDRNLDATTTLPAHPGEPKISPNIFENNVNPSRSPSILEKNIHPDELRERESEIEPSRNEKNKSEDPKS